MTTERLHQIVREAAARGELPVSEDRIYSAPPAHDLHSDGDACSGLHCGNPEHGWAAPLDRERLAKAIVVGVRSQRAPIGYAGDGWPAYWEKGRPATVLHVTSLAAAIADAYESADMAAETADA